MVKHGVALQLSVSLMLCHVGAKHAVYLRLIARQLELLVKDVIVSLHEQGSVLESPP